MNRVRFIKSPRPNDPAPQQAIWTGTEIGVVSSQEDTLPETYLWVDYEDIIRAIEERGDRAYADFFRQLRTSPGGRFAPGLCIRRDTCEDIT